MGRVSPALFDDRCRKTSAMKRDISPCKNAIAVAHRPRQISVCFHRKMDIFQCQPALRDDIIDLGDMRQPLPSPGTAYLSLPRMREIQGAAVVLFFGGGSSKVLLFEQ